VVALLVILGVLVVLGVLGWWSSGRSRRRFPGPDASHEVARSEGYLYGTQHRIDDMGPHL
jgi:hypothetical protein